MSAMPTRETENALHVASDNGDDVARVGVKPRVICGDKIVQIIPARDVKACYKTPKGEDVYRVICWALIEEESDEYEENEITVFQNVKGLILEKESSSLVVVGEDESPENHFMFYTYD